MSGSESLLVPYQEAFHHLASLSVRVTTPHPPPEERVAAGFWPHTQPSEEEYSDSNDDPDDGEEKMDAKSKSYEVSAEGGQTFAGQGRNLPAFLMHNRIKEFLDSELRDQSIKCAYAANQLRGPAQTWFVRTVSVQPILLQK
ncbi:hypothetical protein K470DRAFT_22282 [Piedraia hortae CBS 480.64]|uniref:Uncharacterized protein n=1 Tax=Piedraia hortae CBS 480.64 TaxID=1314780 RepID=A0A6A7C482_9PEZI|nr:hypothetical protein K470DRAFT_22282 [Piedraia hortae CBS 480.64]